MTSLKNMTACWFRAVPTINKQLQQNCKFFSAQTVINPLPKKTTFAEPVIKSQPVAKNENVIKLKSTNPLTDSFGRHHTYLRISLTERCNLRYQQHSAQYDNWLGNNTSSKMQPISLLTLPWPTSRGQISRRNFCQLTHVDADGKAKMVDVSGKNITDRTATARAIVEIGPTITNLIEANNMSKGDVLSIAQLAGIMGAKKTSEIIPLCHNIFLSSVKVNAILDKAKNLVEITATVRCSGKTGVEMEALTAVSLAALTVYDMCKAVSHDIVIKDIRLCEKSGGKRYFKHNDL